MAVMYYIASCMRPLNTVDKPGFRVMMRVLNPRYQPPSRRTLTATYLPKMYEETKGVVKGLLSAAHFKAFTTDGWTSEARDSYLSLTAHFLDQEWVLVEVTLGCRLLKEDHAGEYLGDVLKEMLAEWEVPIGSIAAFTTDNGDNMRVAVEALPAPHVRCFAHTVNNGINAFMSTCKKLQSALKDVHEVRNWLNSDKVWRHYEESTKKRFNVTPTKIPSPCKTRCHLYGGDDLLDLAEPQEREGKEEQDDDDDDDDDIPLAQDPELIPTNMQGTVVQFLKKRFKPDPLASARDVDYVSARACNGVLARCSFLDPRFREEILEEDRAHAKLLLLAELKEMPLPEQQPNPSDSSESGR
ncbi:hypothetical protein FOCC_FOCC014590 [Frankliniella occidentalis]|nr:hypothetical protein FOCC_FOCC014590 [Frankliniella occidentalis]